MMRAELRWLGLLLVVAVGGRVQADDQWPQFRGPGGAGVGHARDLPVEFGEGRNVRWKTEIHGKGWSSPVVWGSQVWMTTATEDGKRMYAVCVDRDHGRVVHDVLVFENESPAFCHPTNSYASPTPAIESNRLYVHFGSYGTACLDTQSGKILWQRRDLPCDHFRGPASSPVIDDKCLYVAFDGFDLQYVVALDKQTGQTVWRRDRNIDYGTDNGDRKKAYSTAVLVEVDGQRQLISPSAAATVAYDPATGDELWRVRHGGMNAAIPPLYGHGLVYIAAGSGPMSLVALKPNGRGDVTDSHVDWNLGKSVPKRSGPVLSGDYLYMIDDSGVASCVQAKSGEIVWQKRLRGREFRASPVLVDGKLYCFSVDGDCHVLAAQPEYKLLASNQLEHGCQASPAIADDAMFVRTIHHLYRIQSTP